MKFRFPNKHDVYMHDTPTKNLFNAEVRTFSHGCMRVRDPQRLAELVLAEDQDWTAARVAAAISGGPQNNQINLARKVPVHITYFTAVVDDDGKLKLFPDIYGHEARIALGMEGKAHLIARLVKEEKRPRAPMRSAAWRRPPPAAGPAAARRTGCARRSISETIDDLLRTAVGNVLRAGSRPRRARPDVAA